MNATLALLEYVQTKNPHLEHMLELARARTAWALGLELEDLELEILEELARAAAASRPGASGRIDPPPTPPFGSFPAVGAGG